MKFATRLLVLVLAFSSTNQNAFAAVKAGSPCPKLNNMSTSGGKLYTCIKSGKKLIWNKGVAVKRTADSISALPSPSSSPTPSVTLQPEPSVTKISFIPWGTTFEAEEMTKIALAKTSDYFGNVKPSNAYSFYVDSAITASDREWITKVLDYANGAFSDVLQGRVKVFLGSTHEWSAATLRSAGTWVGDPQGQYPCSNGVHDAYCAGLDLTLLIYSDIYKTNSDYRWDAGRRSTPAHELFHNVQFRLGVPPTNQVAYFVPPDSPVYIPRWLMEGSANYFGLYVIEKLGLDSYQTGRKQQINSNSAYRNVVPLVQYDNFTSDPYGIGQAASEYIIASVGFENFLNIWKYTKIEGSFSKGFAKATGLEISDFYTKFEAARHSMKIGSG